MKNKLTSYRKECDVCGLMKHCIVEFDVMGTQASLCVDCFYAQRSMQFQTEEEMMNEMINEIPLEAAI